MTNTNTQYEIIMGIEIHLQLNTEMKMFCTCKNDPFHSDANSNVCPVCLGLPGALPVPNEVALKKALKMSSALGSKLNKKIIFERKNYFYPDLPKGFQLTCPHNPIATGGKYDSSFSGSLLVRWREIHLEEDTAKSLHKNGKTWINLNKSGVPLLEMVTEPDFRDIEEAVNFCKEIQLVARKVGVSKADMEKGQMRLEANISLRKQGQTELPDYRVELKNINSFGFMRKALLAEVKRQTAALENGEKLYQETRGFNESKGETFVQRSKEEAHDYRYFPEPDIPAINLTDEYIKDITDSVLDLPSDVRIRLHELGLKNDQYVAKLTNNDDLFKKFDKVFKKLSKEKGMKINSIASLVLDNPEYTNSSAEEIIESVKEKESSKISEDNELLPIIEEVISENEKAVNDYKLGNENSLQFMLGQVMKKTRGQADPATAKKLLLSKL